MKTIVSRYLILGSLLFAAGYGYGQSSDQMFPTPVRSPEIATSIKARAIGDPRLTTYYYTFEGDRGDVFINVQSKNFTGDIDVYVVPSQQPLTKIVIYGDQPETETGRVIYLRKPERLLLRVQGRSPGDDDASVRIKFAGSFAASKLDDTENPAVPKVETRADSNVRVNSVGTIIEVVPKSTPTPAADSLDESTDRHEPETVRSKKDDASEERKVEAEEVKVPQVVVTDPVVEEKKEEPATAAEPRGNRNRRRSTTAGNKTAPPAERKDATPKTVTPKTAAAKQRAARIVKEEPPKVDPMQGINLVVYFKDGSRIDRPMTEVLRFSVERAILTIISKNGTIGRYNMTDVSRVSIE